MVKVIRVILPILIFIGGFIFASSFSSPNVANAQACTTPPQVQNVLIEYPACDSGGNCNFTQGSCSWNTTTGAANYQVTVTEVDTGASVINQSVSSSTLELVFAVTQGRTYKCDVAAVNSCGQAGPAGTHSLLCEADAAVTTAPTQSSQPTATPTLTVKPTVPPAGVNIGIISGGIASILMIAGLLIFLT